MLLECVSLRFNKYVDVFGSNSYKFINIFPSCSDDSLLSPYVFVGVCSSKLLLCLIFFLLYGVRASPMNIFSEDLGSFTLGQMSALRKLAILAAKSKI